MMPKDLIRHVEESFDLDRPVICQLNDGNNNIWYVELKLSNFIRAKDSNYMNVIDIRLPDTMKVPSRITTEVEVHTCPKGHVFPMFPDHPVLNNGPLCPHCVGSFLY